MKLRSMFVGILFGVASSANAALILTVDLSTPDAISLTATSANSSATVDGGTFAGFYLASFFDSTALSTSLNSDRVSGDLTTAENTSNNSPLLSSFGTNLGLNVWSYTDDDQSSFVSGNRALTGSGTWTVDNTYYLAALAGPSSGDIYFPTALDSGIASATLVGQWSKVPRDVPAPATLALMGLGLAGLAFSRRKKA